MSDFENHYYEEAFGNEIPETVECEARTLRTCPRCGAKLFEDMDTCYGCLYDFKQSEHAGAMRNYPMGTPAPIPQGDEEIWGSLDEIIPEAQPQYVPAQPSAPMPESQYVSSSVPQQPVGQYVQAPQQPAAEPAKILRLAKGERLEIVGANLKLVLCAAD